MSRAGQRQPTDEVMRRRRAAVAGHLGDVTTARSLLTDGDPSVRATALGALARAGGLRRDDLVNALHDSDAAVRRRTAEVVASLDDNDPAGDDVSLLDLLDDPDASVIETAAWACGERSPVEPDAVGRLGELATHHDDALIREAAVAALGAIGDPSGLGAILSATTDKATVRRRAVLALAPFHGPEVTAALERARTDRDWQVRQAAEDLTED